MGIFLLAFSLIAFVLVILNIDKIQNLSPDAAYNGNEKYKSFKWYTQNLTNGGYLIRQETTPTPVPTAQPIVAHTDTFDSEEGLKDWKMALQNGMGVNEDFAFVGDGALFLRLYYGINYKERGPFYAVSAKKHPYIFLSAQSRNARIADADDPYFIEMDFWNFTNPNDDISINFSLEFEGKPDKTLYHFAVYPYDDDTNQWKLQIKDTAGNRPLLGKFPNWEWEKIVKRIKGEDVKEYNCIRESKEQNGEMLCILSEGSDDVIKTGMGEMNKLRVEKDGSDIKCYINGKLVTQVEDDQISGDRIGFRVGSEVNEKIQRGQTDLGIEHWFAVDNFVFDTLTGE